MMFASAQRFAGARHALLQCGFTGARQTVEAQQVDAIDVNGDGETAELGGAVGADAVKSGGERCPGRRFRSRAQPIDSHGAQATSEPWPPLVRRKTEPTNAVGAHDRRRRLGCCPPMPNLRASSLFVTADSL